MRFIHSELQRKIAVAADGTLRYDLPVNPLSVIYLEISPLNESSTITTWSLFNEILTAIESVEVTFRGAGVYVASLVDIVALNALHHGIGMQQSNAVSTDSDRRSVVVPIIFGRHPWMPDECFPRSRRGELELALTYDIADAAYDGLQISIETLELPEADPTHFERVTTLAQTFAAVGNNDIDLPIGHVIRGILGFGTTGFAGATPAPTLADLRVLVDNSEWGYASGTFEVLRAVMGCLDGRSRHLDEHFHQANGGAVAYEATLDPEHQGKEHEQYVFLSYDPMANDLFVLDTAGAGRVHIRVDADAANAVRFLPVEKVPVTALKL